MSDERINRIVDEFIQLQSVYNDYCNTVMFLLNNLLNNNSLQYQMVSSRVKKIDSIKNKIVENKVPSSVVSITEIDDIAGCRVIFYLESEIQKFIHLIYSEFDVKKNNLRYSDDDYNAHHLVIKLKEDRLKLAEYSSFKGLQCELQLTTVLFHAWSEVSHNISYKSPKELTEFNMETLEFLKGQLKDIMKNFIKPANNKFEFIYKEYLNLQEGRRIFDSKFLHEILHSQNRNEMYQKLLLLGQYVKKYGDKTPKEYELPNLVLSIIEKSKALKTIKPQYLGFGYEHRHIVEECIEILDVIKNQSPEQVFSILVELSLEKNKDIQEKALDEIKSMSKYKFKALEKIGVSVQKFILDQIKSWGINKQLKRIDSVMKVMDQVFELEFEHNFMEDYKTLSIGFGLLPAHENIKKLREEAMQLLQNMFIKSKKITEKEKILQTLSKVTKTPHRGNYSDDIENLVKENTISLINWYLLILKDIHQLKIIKKIDEQLNWIQRRFSNSIEGFIELNELIQNKSDYIIYKDLVGYDSDYLKETDWRKAREQRNEKVLTYAKNISEESEKQWKGIIIEICIGFSESEQGKYTYFNNLLYNIGLLNPNFARNLIENYEKEVGLLLYHLMAGLFLSDKEYANKKLEEWINGKQLRNAILTYLYVEQIEIDTLTTICEKAIKDKDKQVLNEIFRVLNSEKINKSQAKSLYINVIKELSRLKDFWWIHQLWLREGSILYQFNETEHDQILDIIVECPDIDYHVEQVLIPIAEVSVIKIINLFEKRILKSRRQRLFSKYDAVPYHFHGLQNVLAKKPDECIPLIFEWFKKNDRNFNHEGSNLLQRLYPSFDEPLQSFLCGVMSAKNIDDAKVILQILREYDGDTRIYDFSKLFVESFKEYPDLLKELMYVLSETGVVTGEYGFSEALEQTKNFIRKKWKKEKSEAIRKFQKDFVDYLNAQITAEKKRADERIFQMQYEHEIQS